MYTHPELSSLRNLTSKSRDVPTIFYSKFYHVMQYSTATPFAHLRKFCVRFFTLSYIIFVRIPTSSWTSMQEMGSRLALCTSQCDSTATPLAHIGKFCVRFFTLSYIIFVRIPTLGRYFIIFKVIISCVCVYRDSVSEFFGCQSSLFGFQGLC